MFESFVFETENYSSRLILKGPILIVIEGSMVYIIRKRSEVKWTYLTLDHPVGKTNFDRRKERYCGMGSLTEGRRGIKP